MLFTLQIIIIYVGLCPPFVHVGVVEAMCLFDKKHTNITLSVYCYFPVESLIYNSDFPSFLFVCFLSPGTQTNY